MSAPYRELSDRPCPHCHYNLNAVTPAIGDDTHYPHDGDVGFCLNCGHPHMFKSAGDDVQMVELPADFFATRDPACNREFARIQAGILTFIAQHGKNGRLHGDEESKAA